MADAGEADSSQHEEFATLAAFPVRLIDWPHRLRATFRNSGFTETRGICPGGCGAASLRMASLPVFNQTSRTLQFYSLLENTRSLGREMPSNRRKGLRIESFSFAGMANGRKSSSISVQRPWQHAFHAARGDSMSRIACVGDDGSSTANRQVDRRFRDAGSVAPILTMRFSNMPASRFPSGAAPFLPAGAGMDGGRCASQ